MNWWRRLLLGSKAEEQLEKELRFHLDQYTADLIERDSTPRRRGETPRSFLAARNKARNSASMREALAGSRIWFGTWLMLSHSKA